MQVRNGRTDEGRKRLDDGRKRLDEITSSIIRLIRDAPAPADQWSILRDVDLSKDARKAAIRVGVDEKLMSNVFVTIAQHDSAGVNPDTLAMLIKERNEIAIKLGEAKVDLDMPMRDGGRETEVITSARAEARREGVNPDLISDVLRLLIKHARDIQHDLAHDAARA